MIVKGKERKVKSLSHVRFFVTPWTVAHQAPLTIVFSRQEYWSGLPFLSPGDLFDPGIKPLSPALAGGSLPLSHMGSPPTIYDRRFPAGSVVKNLPANAGNAGLIPGSKRSPGEGNSKPLQYSCLGNPMDRGTPWATVQGVPKESDTT